MRLTTWGGGLALLLAALATTEAPASSASNSVLDFDAGMPRPHAAGFWTWGCDGAGACVAVNDAPAREAWFKAQVWGGVPPTADMRIAQDSAGCLSIHIRSGAFMAPPEEAPAQFWVRAVRTWSEPRLGTGMPISAPATWIAPGWLEVTSRQSWLLGSELSLSAYAIPAGHDVAWGHMFLVGPADSGSGDGVPARGLNLVQRAFLGARLGRPLPQACG